MRKHRRWTQGAPLTAACVLGALLTGCDPARPGPLDPPAAPAAFAKPVKPSTSFSVAAADAVTAATQPMSDSNETEEKLSLYASNGFRAGFAFDATHASALAWLDDPTLGSCWIDAGGNATIPRERLERALAQLVASLEEPRQAFAVHVDKTALGAASTVHSLASTFRDASGRLFDLRLGSSYGASTVTGSLESNPSELRYTGGTVYVKDRSERPHFHVICHNLDEVAVTITRTS